MSKKSLYWALEIWGAIIKPENVSLCDKRKGLEENNDTVGRGEKKNLTQQDLLKWDERRFFIDSEYKKESLDMQDVTVGMSLPNHRERSTVKTVRQKNAWKSKCKTEENVKSQLLAAEFLFDSLLKQYMFPIVFLQFA